MKKSETEKIDIDNVLKIIHTYIYNAVHYNKICFEEDSQIFKRMDDFHLCTIHSTDNLEPYTKLKENGPTQLRGMLKALSLYTVSDNKNFKSLMKKTEKSKHYDDWDPHYSYICETWDRCIKVIKERIKVLEEENLNNK